LIGSSATLPLVGYRLPVAQRLTARYPREFEDITPYRRFGMRFWIPMLESKSNPAAESSV
jgi:hypothetical protein